MPDSKVQAVCGTCAWKRDCSDLATLEQLRGFIENSGLAAEMALASGKRYRLGCERYRPARRPAASSQPRLKVIAIEPQHKRGS